MESSRGLQEKVFTFAFEDVLVGGYVGESKEFAEEQGRRERKEGFGGMVSDRNEYNPVNKTGMGDGIKEGEVIEEK